MTSIKDQKHCGSCVSFGVAATIESMAIIEHGNKYDLSEAELFFCAGPRLVLALVRKEGGTRHRRFHT